MRRKPNGMRSQSPSRPSLSLGIQCAHLAEPLLAFGSGGLHVDPKSGIARFGPRSYVPMRRHPQRIHVGLIGTAETLAKAQMWIEENARGVLGDDKHPEFPGFEADRGFFSSLEFDQGWNAQISQAEIKDLLGIRLRKDRFEQAVGLIGNKLRLLAERDSSPHYVVIGLLYAVVLRCRAVDYYDKQAGQTHRDLRRALKSVAMQYRMPTQLLRQPTMEGKDKDHPSKIAWNFFTGLYFKAGGVPWAPYGLIPGTCYLGISFFQPPGAQFAALQTSLVQAFDEHGDGLVLRGHPFEWDAATQGTRSPHLASQQAEQLIEDSLAQYQEQMRQTPQRVVVHKTSRYWPDERSGFEAVLRARVSRYDLVALESRSDVRLITTSKYPPLRGTRFTIGDLDFLYTTGFISTLNEFHAMHVPSPLQIADHIGQDTPREVLLREILTLSKMNWNSARFGGLYPITLKFSRLVADIMREIPADREPLPQFKFYM